MPPTSPFVFSFIGPLSALLQMHLNPTAHSYTHQHSPLLYSVKENPGLSEFYPNGVSDRGFGACGVWGWLVGSAPLARGEVGWGHSRFFAVFFSL